MAVRNLRFAAASALLHLLLLLLVSPSSKVAAASSPCSATIPGLWNCSSCKTFSSQVIRFGNLSSPLGGGWYALPDVQTGWNWGSGNFSADYTSASVAFTNGRKNTGKVSSACDQIKWSDNSVWEYMGSPPPVRPVRIHMVAHSHGEWRVRRKKTKNDSS
jgi:hypothetical protein